MRTVELSEEKARTLAEWLAPKWADIAMRLVAANVPVNTPYRTHGETLTSRTYVARIRRRKREAAALAAVLEALGVRLPEVEREAVIGKWARPGTTKPMDMWKGAPASERERVRLVAIIKEQIK